jgi:hypothetical protein
MMSSGVIIATITADQHIERTRIIADMLMPRIRVYPFESCDIKAGSEPRGEFTAIHHRFFIIIVLSYFPLCD